MTTEERLGKVERNQATDGEKIRTLYAANETVCRELTKATAAMNEVRTQIAVLVATLPNDAEREDVHNRLTALEMKDAKQQGGLQVGKYLIGAGCALIGFLVANADKIVTILQHN